MYSWYKGTVSFVGSICGLMDSDETEGAKSNGHGSGIDGLISLGQGAGGGSGGGSGSAGGRSGLPIPYACDIVATDVNIVKAVSSSDVVCSSN